MCDNVIYERRKCWTALSPMMDNHSVHFMVLQMSSLIYSCSCQRLLVGAPRAKALSRQKSKVTGGLYSCEMTSDACTRVDFDNAGEIFAEHFSNFWTVNKKNHAPYIFFFSDYFVPRGCAEDTAKESKENQWMGVSVSSQGPGGKILVRLLVFLSDHDIKTQINIKSDRIKSFFFLDFGSGRLVPIATSAGTTWARASSPVTLLAGATS